MTLQDQAAVGAAYHQDSPVAGHHKHQSTLSTMSTMSDMSDDSLSFAVNHSEKSAGMPYNGVQYDGVAVEKSENRDMEVHPGGIGLLPSEVYDKQLLPAVAMVRRRIMQNLPWESDVLAAMQVSKVR